MYSLLFGILIFFTVLILHTYLFYPLLMITFFPRRKKELASFSTENELPVVAVLIAAYNEEQVIGEKIRSVFNSDYPADKLKLYVGSDASADNTDHIISGLQQQHPNLELVRFSGRVGKISIINHLQSLGDEDILVMTDANVIFDRSTVRELVKHFKDKDVGIVAGNIVKKSQSSDGIAFQEKVYLSIENRIKASESNGFDLVMGAEGGCYAIRNSLFSKVPLKFIVDDFYITMQVLLRGSKVIFNSGARCFEDVPGDSPGEYRRKVRISSGNFQNLLFFRNVLFRPFSPIGFTFWSHKVLRWLTPFFLLITLITSGFLTLLDADFLWFFLLQAIFFLLPLFDRIIHFRISALKFISHFFLMNLALLEGFVKFIRGIKSSVWQPLKRDV